MNAIENAQTIGQALLNNYFANSSPEVIYFKKIK